MSESKKGLIKVTLELEINEALMEASKEWIGKMMMMKAKWKKGEGKEGEE